ncbi:efflux RND transporter periplasmic adaptor subunit [Chitinimonas sp. BJYL2]|uniref:efflux RND transporter periplasmic adaptor subunit n=1 Tax=Chitinimonas sp. BJYL2 TaxID=2976696 RepID=UPI0022B2BA8B|nr:efflux RND transporter periplasmic adaptor subunit [Chitinimonas sp. BJYL2]
MNARLPRFSRRTLAISIGVALLVGTVAVTQTSRAAPEDKKKDKTPVVLELANSDVVKVMDVNLIQPLALSGTLTPVRQTVINAEVEGALAEVLVRPGDSVKAGQVLARFETSDLGNQLAMRQASFERSRAELQLAEKNRDRNANLIKQGFISSNAFDVSESSLSVAVAQHKADAAALGLARKAMNDSAVRAPISGIVAERKVEPGTRVGINQRLFSVVDLGEMEYEAAVPVSALASVKLGQDVTLTIDGFAQDALKGRVERIAPVADSASRMVSVYIRIKNPDHLLKGGMFARGQLAVARAEHAATLPFGAIRDMETSAPYVMAVENGKAVRKPVTLGILNDLSKEAAIRSGVTAGATVIIAKVENVKAGQQVKLPGATQPAKS